MLCYKNITYKSFIVINSKIIKKEIYMVKKHSWNELNERQKSALTAIYKADQNAEKKEKSRWHQGLDRRPAAVWRKLRYPDLHGYETDLHKQLREVGVIDNGLGSTLQAIERRNFIKCDYVKNAFNEQELISIELTKSGRAAARQGLGESAPKSRPKGELKEKQWAALVAAYIAEDEGLEWDDCGNYSGFSFRWTLLPTFRTQVVVIGNY